MLYKDIILSQLDKKYSAWNKQIQKMAGIDYNTYAKLAIGLLAELKGYISAMCDTVLGLYNAEAMDAQEADYLIKQILKVSYNVTDAVRLTASTCHSETTAELEKRSIN